MPEIKVLRDNGDDTMTVAGYGIIFGGADLANDRFTAKTDLWLGDRLSATPPVLYQHGQDPLIGKTAIGRVTSAKPDSVGLWVEAQLQTSKKYLDAIRQLIAKGVPLGWSSGSIAHLVQRVKTSTPDVMEITSWPLAELSLVITPAEPRTLGVKELKALAELEPLLSELAEDAAKAERTTTAKEAKGVPVTDLPDSAFAFIETGGTLDDEKKTFPRAKRHYPHHDESGAVDADALRIQLAEAMKATNPAGLAHLLLHQHAIDTGSPDEAHAAYWADGAAPSVLVAAAKFYELAQRLAADRQAMERLGVDTKSGKRINTASRTQLKDLHLSIGYVRENADGIERGDDGTAQVDLYRAAFDLLDLEEAA